MEETRKGEFSLVGKIHTGRFIIKYVLHTTVKVWKTVRPFSFQDVGSDMYLITFECLADKEGIMKERPWLLDSSLFSMKLFDGCTPHSNWIFPEPFWVQMHQLLLACMNENVSTQVGQTSDLVLECDVRDDGNEWKIVV